MALTYKALQAQVKAMEQKITRNAQHILRQGRLIDDDAKDTGRIADQIAAKNIDPDTVAETKELSKITSGLSQTVISYAAAGQDTARLAKATSDQAAHSHAGIQEAVDRSNVTGITQVDADWFEQI